MSTIFDKIIDKTVETTLIYEDEHCMAFDDINPQAPVHILLIPKQRMAKLSDAISDDQSLLGHLMLTASLIANRAGLNDDFRIVINNGKGAGQTVFHLHLHIIGGRPLQWPPG